MTIFAKIIFFHSLFFYFSNGKIFWVEIKSWIFVSNHWQYAWMWLSGCLIPVIEIMIGCCALWTDTEDSHVFWNSCRLGICSELPCSCKILVSLPFTTLKTAAFFGAVCIRCNSCWFPPCCDRNLRRPFVAAVTGLWLIGGVFALGSPGCIIPVAVGWCCICCWSGGIWFCIWGGWS